MQWYINVIGRLKTGPKSATEHSSLFYSQTLGNHEFDHGVEGVVPFIDALETPITLANVDVSQEPTLQGKLQNSIIITRGERQIGIIGLINRLTYVSTLAIQIVHRTFDRFGVCFGRKSPTQGKLNF